MEEEALREILVKVLQDYARLHIQVLSAARLGFHRVGG